MSELRRVDANLVIVLDALLTHRNLTRAGEAIGMAQPSVSGALSRLRRQLGDEILVRAGRGFDLTPKAQSLQPLVTAALTEIAATYSVRASFDPTTSVRRFLVSASDYAFAELGAPIGAMMSAEAPRMSVDFDSLPLTDTGVSDNMLMRRDVVITGTGRGVPGHRTSLYSDRFVVVVDARNPRLRSGRLSQSDLEAMSHVVWSFGELRTPATDMLDLLGIVPRVAARAPGSLQVALMVSGTDYVAIVPERIADRYGAALSLVVADTPLRPATLVEAAHWHPSRVDDPALRWFLGLLRRAAERVEFPDGIHAEA
ncbi:LysR family transcriptional regulator [Okibacterium endophyticum]